MLRKGMMGTIESQVKESMTAESVGSGELKVYATPMLIALAEETAWKSVAGELEPGQGTVGTKINIEHIAATPVGMKVRCETELIDIDRRRLTFSVNVYDETGKIAEGIHERFIVDSEKFQEKANAKEFSQEKAERIAKHT